MCLIASTKEALLASEPIKVYKLVLLKDGEYYTPYRETRLTEHPESPATEARVDVLHTPGLPPYVMYKVESEAIHAFTTKGRAEDIGERFFATKVWTVIEGIIPAGTLYWKSACNDANIAAKYIDFGLDEYKKGKFIRWIRKIFKR